MAVPPSASRSRDAHARARGRWLGRDDGATGSWRRPRRPRAARRARRRGRPRAAPRAASRRLGSTSVACMEPDTSVTSTTAARSTGTATVACGRASATASAASARGDARPAGGAARTAWPPGAGEDRHAGEAHAVAPAAPPRPGVGRRQHGQRGEREQHEGRRRSSPQRAVRAASSQGASGREHHVVGPGRAQLVAHRLASLALALRVALAQARRRGCPPPPACPSPDRPGAASPRRGQGRLARVAHLHGERASGAAPSARSGRAQPPGRGSRRSPRPGPADRARRPSRPSAPGEAAVVACAVRRPRPRRARVRSPPAPPPAARRG